MMKATKFSGTLALAITLVIGGASATLAKSHDDAKSARAKLVFTKSTATTAVAATTTRRGHEKTTVVTTRVVKTRHYDCSKRGNFHKVECGGPDPALDTLPMAPAPVEMPAPAPASQPTAARVTTTTTHHAVVEQSSSTTVPEGTTAICRDGSTSQSQSRSGTCSRHGGVARWM